MSQKRMKGVPTRGEGMVMTYREAIFAVVNAAAKVLASSVDVSFEKTKYGSRRNGFFKRNYQYFEELAQAPVSDAANEFGDTLKSFGLQVGQTIVAALQAGIIDTSAVETAMQASNDSGVFGFMAFAAWSDNTQSKAKYIRSDVGNELVVGNAAQAWSRAEDPLIMPRVTSFIGNTTGTGTGMKVTSFEVRGENLESIYLSDAKIVSGNKTIQGTWSTDGREFTVSENLIVPVSSIWTFSLIYDGSEVAKTNIYGSGGVSGE